MDDRELAGTLAKIIENQIAIDKKIQYVVDAIYIKDESKVEKVKEEKPIEEEKPTKKEEDIKEKSVETDYDDGLSDSDYE